MVEAVDIGAEEIQILRALLHGFARSGQNFRSCLLKFCQENVCPEGEHCTVPKNVFVLQQFNRHIFVGFFNKLGNLTNACMIGKLLRRLNIAIFCGRKFRLNSEGDQMSSFGSFNRVNDRFRKSIQITNAIIGRENQQNCFRQDSGGGMGREGNGWRCVFAGRFENDGAVFNAEVAERFGNQKAVLSIADDDRRRKPLAVADTSDGVLQQGTVFVCEGQKLLRQSFARHRPKAGAGAAGQHNRDDHLLFRLATPIQQNLNKESVFRSS